MPLLAEFDFIVASPTYVGAGGRAWDHTRLVIQEATLLAEDLWPFDVADPPAIINVSPTARLVGRTWRQRREIATGPLRAALQVPDPRRTEGKSFLVYDDVFTDGQTLNEVAGCLRDEGGAARVAV
jgi:predicted amidophosphoribosyltransferase